MNETEDRPMCSDRSHAGLEDSGVIQAVQEYLSALEAGHEPDRQQFLARYPALAQGLAECLDALEFVYTAAPRPDPALVEGQANASASPAESPLPGLLGDFRILREIGRGGMGIV